MREFVVMYLFLEPKEATVKTNDARNAAASFLNANGGKEENWGRCVVVLDNSSGATSTWAYIRIGRSNGFLQEQPAYETGSKWESFRQGTYII